MAGPLGRNGLSAGDLRNRVRVESPVPARTKYGDERQTWETAAARVFCAVRAASGAEAFGNAGGVQAQVSHKVTMRREAATLAITPKHRLVWLDGANAVLNVVAVLPSVGASNALDVWCLQEA